ncbi:hypothetical protein CDA63_04810 [Hymenobacter amundsenii]|uniref:Secretion system C-terminal sorting domain-containing protein n=1 Tax=Hymenobacter amundsenii TaxID=2006685 RepID=A0A246FNK8_9BACT|nr:hypothetical protein CDA63_04810 [Hymenobacter amundsenii]
MASPNPTTGQLQLTAVAYPRIITFTDAIGRRQKTATLPAGATSFDVTDCSPGLYVLSCTGNGQTQNQRIVITAP